MRNLKTLLQYQPPRPFHEENAYYTLYGDLIYFVEFYFPKYDDSDGHGRDAHSVLSRQYYTRR